MLKHRLALPLAILFLLLLTFGLLAPSLGLYWDDWAKLLVHHLWGPDGYWAYYAEDRPLSSWTHILFTPLLGSRPVAWYLFELGLVGLSAWALAWVVAAIWPGRARWSGAAAALIFLIYPVFVQYPAAVTFHQQWLQFAAYLFSLALMVRGFRARGRRAWVYHGLAVALMLVQLSVTEYFVPLELLRLLVLWLAASNRLPALPEGEIRPTWKNRLAAAARAYLPYFLLTAGYIVYRLFFIRLSGADPYRADTLYNLVEAPLPALLDLGRMVVQDSLYTLVTAWTQVFSVGRIESIAPFNLLALAAAALGGLGVFGFLLRCDGKTNGEETPAAGLPLQMALLGLAALLLGMLPAWITGREVVFDFHSNRYALPAMFGASLLWTALIDWLTLSSSTGGLSASRLQRAALVAVLVATGVNLHLRVLNDYRWEWRAQRSFFWQLSWRAPYLEPGTALVLEKEPFPEQGLFSMSSALNLLYPVEKDPVNLPYWMYALSPRYTPDTLPEKLGFATTFRSLHFEGGEPGTVLASWDLNQGSCLWVLTGEDAADPFLSRLLKEALPASNLERIHAVPPENWQPPEELFGHEPEHTWCYLFQKADLAKQQGDWGKVVELGEEAIAQGYSPSDARSNAPHEWLPFVEAFSRAGRRDEVREWTRQILEKDARYSQALCPVFARVGGSEEARELAGCE